MMPLDQTQNTYHRGSKRPLLVTLDDIILRGGRLVLGKADVGPEGVEYLEIEVAGVAGDKSVSILIPMDDYGLLRDSLDKVAFGRIADGGGS
jgi:hypothetical protein